MNSVCSRPGLIQSKCKSKTPLKKIHHRPSAPSPSPQTRGKKLTEQIIKIKIKIRNQKSKSIRPFFHFFFFLSFFPRPHSLRSKLPSNNLLSGYRKKLPRSLEYAGLRWIKLDWTGTHDGRYLHIRFVLLSIFFFEAKRGGGKGGSPFCILIKKNLICGFISVGFCLFFGVWRVDTRYGVYPQRRYTCFYASYMKERN